MAQKQFYCPACKKDFTSEVGVYLHFRKALEGWDPIWDSKKPHTRWARNKGVKVSDEGLTNDFENLKEVIYKELGEKGLSSQEGGIISIPGMGDLIAHLSGIRVNDSDKSRAATVSGHLIKYVMKEKWHPLSESKRQQLIRPSTARLWNSYMNIRNTSKMSTKGAAEQAIAAELMYLIESVVEKMG